MLIKSIGGSVGRTGSIPCFPKETDQCCSLYKPKWFKFLSISVSIQPQSGYKVKSIRLGYLRLELTHFYKKEISVPTYHNIFQAPPPNLLWRHEYDSQVEPYDIKGTRRLHSNQLHPCDRSQEAEVSSTVG